jgi:hypothetical protein
MSKSGKFVLKGIFLAYDAIACAGMLELAKHITRNANPLAQFGAGCAVYYINSLIAEEVAKILTEIDEM